MDSVSFPIVSLFYAGLASLWGFALALRLMRSGPRSTLRLGGRRPEIPDAVRVRGSHLAYLPVTLVLLMLAEMAGAPRLLVHATGAGLATSCLAQAVGLWRATARTWR